jgi:NTP pyrophosphatase (non-canonical NTP hydrolase)
MRTINPTYLVGLSHIANHLYKTAYDSGFHTNDDSNLGRFAEYIANLHGEVSELWEAYRKGKLNEPCDKPIDLTCAAEELADIIIRALDTARGLNIDIGSAIAIKDEYNQSRPYMHNKLA